MSTSFTRMTYSRMTPFVSSKGGACHDKLADVEVKAVISGLVGGLVGTIIAGESISEISIK